MVEKIFFLSLRETRKKYNFEKKKNVAINKTKTKITSRAT